MPPAQTQAADGSDFPFEDNFVENEPLKGMAKSDGVRAFEQCMQQQYGCIGNTVADPFDRPVVPDLPEQQAWPTTKLPAQCDGTDNDSTVGGATFTRPAARTNKWAAQIKKMVRARDVLATRVISCRIVCHI